MLPTFATLRPALVVAIILAMPPAAMPPAAETSAAEPAARAALELQFSATVLPLLQTYCHECHAGGKSEGMLDLAGFTSLSKVAAGHQKWAIVLERLEAKEMPPEESLAKPTPKERELLVNWIRAVRKQEAERNAGDPGVVPVRRLSNAEYNYTIRDLTGVDIRPTKTFPIDPANEAGFDNSGESLAMSPALLQKYLEAARQVAEHLVLKPQGIAFAPHPAMTDTDRDKYCVKRIVDFYQRQPTDLAAYFLAAWQYRHRGTLGAASVSLDEVAAAEKVSPKYLTTVWRALTEEPAEVGPLGKLQGMWRELVVPDGKDAKVPRAACEQMRDFVVELRQKLAARPKNLDVRGIHKGAQAFVLWKNDQYAAGRRTYRREALQVQAGTDEDRFLDADLKVPADETERARHEASFARFCDVFPDAFYIAERGRDYVGKSKDQQEKGRLLSAGFHSMMGYYRDDAPLYDLILDDSERAEIDTLWQELDFIANVPQRQYAGFLWFERTDSRWLRDEQFDFARSEDKDASTEANVSALAALYLEKAQASGGEGVPIRAIEDYFRLMNGRLRQVEQARLAAEPSHLAALLDFAERAFRRPLSAAERDELLAFYRSLREQDAVTHEEAVQDLLVFILMSPNFCYRMDLAKPGDEQRPLGDYELASRLSYFLWSSMPDRELLDRAAAGDLREPAVLKAQSRRMLHDGQFRNLAVEFGGNWLDFRRFEDHNSVDRERFPAFTNELRQAMFEEPIRFFVDLAQRNGSVLEFLDARHTFVNADLAKHYGLSAFDSAGGEWQRVDDAASAGRGGLLPMAVFQTANSPGLRTSPVKRGYWVVRRLLGERIPPPPPNVPELPADEAKLGELTLRETLAKHRDHASCAGCHERFDSVGLIFEGYGPIGERRTLDLGGRPVDDRAVFPDKSEGAGIAGLRTYLRNQRQADFSGNLCRKLLSYALGRSLLPSDDSTIVAMQTQLAADGHRFGSLIETIVTSPQFLTKRGTNREGEAPAEPSFNP